MRKSSPLLIGAILCGLALVGSAAVRRAGWDLELAENPNPSAAPALAPSGERAAELRTGPEAGAQRVSFVELDLAKHAGLNVLTADCVDQIPQSIRELAGQRIVLRGYMKPTGVATSLPEFLLVRSTDMCCFARVGRVDHMVAVTLKAGTTADYIDLLPFDVAGRLRIEATVIPEDSGPMLLFLYHLDDAVIIHR
ncbi:MAG: hypothetical protein JSS02_18905 [Planctomycetes bacterium]|nr:hypothetical protein [Planctomycetota bacterium]